MPGKDATHEVEQITGQLDNLRTELIDFFLKSIPLTPAENLAFQQRIRTDLATLKNNVAQFMLIQKQHNAAMILIGLTTRGLALAITNCIRSMTSDDTLIEELFMLIYQLAGSEQIQLIADQKSLYASPIAIKFLVKQGVYKDGLSPLNSLKDDIINANQIETAYDAAQIYLEADPHYHIGISTLKSLLSEEISTYTKIAILMLLRDQYQNHELEEFDDLLVESISLLPKSEHFRDAQVLATMMLEVSNNRGILGDMTIIFLRLVLENKVEEHIKAGIVHAVLHFNPKENDFTEEQQIFRVYQNVIATKNNFFLLRNWGGIEE